MYTVGISGAPVPLGAARVSQPAGENFCLAAALVENLMLKPGFPVGGHRTDTGFDFGNQCCDVASELCNGKLFGRPGWIFRQMRLFGPPAWPGSLIGVTLR